MRLVSGSHPFWGCREDPRLPAEAAFLFGQWNGGQPSTHAVIALSSEGCVVGVFRFIWSEASQAILSVGTWVAAEVRGRGVGLSLWAEAFRMFPGCRRVDVTVGTDEGGAFMARVMSAFPGPRYRLV